MEKWYKELYKRWKQAMEQKDIQERKRMLAELESHPRWAEFEKLLLTEFSNSLKRSLTKATRKMEQGEQQPNIARCVLATMEELKGMGYWDGAENTTYTEALNTLEAYKKLEKKRGEYLARKSAYLAAIDEYTAAKVFLATNLVGKYLDPLGNNIADPMAWYLTATELIDLCHNTLKIDIKLPTLRKYQSLGLIPKPIRLGRNSRYSLLTFLRIAIIQEMKKRGLKLKELEGTIEADLKEILEELEKMVLLKKGSSTEKAIYKMTLLTDPLFEDSMKELMGWGGFIKGLKRAVYRSIPIIDGGNREGNNNGE